MGEKQRSLFPRRRRRRKKKRINLKREGKAFSPSGIFGGEWGRRTKQRSLKKKVKSKINIKCP